MRVQAERVGPCPPPLLSAQYDAVCVNPRRPQVPPWDPPPVHPPLPLRSTMAKTTPKSNSSKSTPRKPQAAPLARYSAYRQVGDFIFLSGIIAVNPQAGLIVKGFGDIPQDAARLIGQTGEF